MSHTTPAAEDYPMVEAAEYERNPEVWMDEAVKHGAIRVVEPDGRDVYIYAAWKHQQLEAEAAASAQWKAAMQRVFGTGT